MRAGRTARRRLVVHHRSGRTDTFHLGAHPPSLSPGDLDLIHRVWLDATRPSDRMSIITMSSGQHHPNGTATERTTARRGARGHPQTSRRADELTPVLRARDYAQLRDMMRNRHAGDVATLLTELSLEDQVVVFRVLPRKDAADIFEYLAQEAKQALSRRWPRKTWPRSSTSMAPDDRTMFLEELPATATRELLDPADPARTDRRDGAPRLSRALGRPSDDAELRRRARGLDRARRPRPRPNPWSRQRNIEPHLRRRRAGAVDRRRSHPRVPARAGGPSRRRPDGPALRRLEGERRPGGGGRGVPAVRPRRPARHRHRRHAHRHRHDRRRAGCGRGDRDAGNPAHRRIGSPRRTVHAHRVRGA